MPMIHLITHINAPIQMCFDLSRSCELHKISTAHTHEQSIEGRGEGLFELGDRVTWKAKHFGVYQKLAMEISAMDYPYSFEDRMIKGIFKSIVHRHYFKDEGEYTVMEDKFLYDVPGGIAGKLFDKLVLKAYMTRLLSIRNAIIKDYAETGRWKEIIQLD